MPAAARWDFIFTATSPTIGLGAGIIADENGSDDLDGPSYEIPWQLSRFQGVWGVIFSFYRENGLNWSGPTASIVLDYKASIPLGGSKTWSDFYLWAQDYTATPPNKVEVMLSAEGGLLWPPEGYQVHLVLGYVPEAANWDGPMDYWIDMNRPGTFFLPVIETADSLQGTKMHLTVYAIPEPSSFIALGFALPVLACAAVRRSRRLCCRAGWTTVMGSARTPLPLSPAR